MVRGAGRQAGNTPAHAAEGTPPVPADPKLWVPPPRPEWVERPHLVSLLDQATAKLIVLSAPAGYGKTTLLAQWHAASAASRCFAWIALDPEDDSPATLWRLLIEALVRACPKLSTGRLRPPEAHAGASITSVLLPRLLTELAGSPVPVTVVLDDYQVISDPACHQQLETLLLHLPPQAHIVLSTRADPPLPLARLRAGGELAELGMSDLRLTPDEAKSVLQTVSGTELDPGDLRILVDRTEGWPGGIYLAGLSLRERPDPAEFIRQFTGSNRYIEDFLAEEVLNRQPDRVRRFLLHTAILGRLTAPLCEAVTGATSAHEIMDTLERENVFLVALDDRRQWFRYHRLFAEALRSQLERAEPGLAPVLHRRACAWHRDQGLAGEAIRHALAAGDTAAAVGLISHHWLEYLDAGRTGSVRAWLQALSEEDIRANPLAAHCAAWTAALSGDREDFMRWLPVVEAAAGPGPLPDGMRSFQSSAALLNGTFGYRGLARMKESAARAVALERDEESPWYALARTALGVALYWHGDLPAASQRLQEAVRCQASIALVRLTGASFLTLVALEQGRLGQAAEMARVARKILADRHRDLGETPQGALAQLATGAVLASQGKLAPARDKLEQALAARRRSPGLSPWPALEILLRLAPVQQDLGNAGGATACLGEARDLLAAFPDGSQAQSERLRRLERRLRAGLQRDSFPGRLTGREEAVLRSLRGSLSLREIGQEMYVSANTVKSHTRAIYRKLGVSSRRDAVQRGRELGIL